MAGPVYDPMGVSKQIADEDVISFLEQVLERATKVDHVSDGLVDLVNAAELPWRPVIEIILSALSGLIDQVEIMDLSLKLKAVLDNPVDVRSALARHKAEGLVGIEDAWRISGLSKNGLDALLKMQMPSGKSICLSILLKT